MEFQSAQTAKQPPLHRPRHGKTNREYRLEPRSLTKRSQLHTNPLPGGTRYHVPARLDFIYYFRYPNHSLIFHKPGILRPTAPG